MVVQTSKSPQLGFYSWHVAENCLTGDEIFADLYGLEIIRAVEGVPIEDVIASIVPGDRERVAFETHSAILSGASGSLTFTVFDGRSFRSVTSVGRCLRAASGIPSVFTGHVFETPDEQISVSGYGSAEVFCRSALSLARNQQKELAARYLSSALHALQA